jgi:2-hydroxy-4-carboxymuconate semialdehyde hemiacetal dehydrogenase
MVCHSQRFIPSLAAERRRVAEGALRVHHLMGRHGVLRRDNVGWTGRRRSWTDDLLWHHGGHLVDFSLWFLGAERAEVLGQVARPDPRTGIPQDLDLLLKTPADQLVCLSLSYNTHLDLDEYLIVGEEDSLRFDHGRLTGPEGVRDDPSARGADHNRLSWEAQDREFLAALREGRPASPSGAEVLPALAILQQVEDRWMPGGRAADS